MNTKNSVREPRPFLQFVKVYIKIFGINNHKQDFHANNISPFEVYRLESPESQSQYTLEKLFKLIEAKKKRERFDKEHHDIEKFEMLRLFLEI